DFNTLKNTLQQCIPFINFYNLTSKEFVDKVFPYREILPEKLCTDLLKAFLTLLNPDSKPIDKSKTVDSKIITSQHAELILKWINGLEITDELASSYEFKLLFRASRDGYSQNKFHEICDNKSRTVTIIEVKDSNEILGGYNPAEWGSDGHYKTTKDSFIFSFANENYILSRVKYENQATLNSHYYGPSFGEKDLIIWDWDLSDINYCIKSSYEKSIRKIENDFDVKECEVFQIDSH
ncbi:hypothetical protein RhiirB3_443614, partial [Rhizophagus irregularis]